MFRTSSRSRKIRVGFKILVSFFVLANGNVGMSIQSYAPYTAIQNGRIFHDLKSPHSLDGDDTPCRSPLDALSMDGWFYRVWARLVSRCAFLIPSVEFALKTRDTERQGAVKGGNAIAGDGIYNRFWSDVGRWEAECFLGGVGGIVIPGRAIIIASFRPGFTLITGSVRPDGFFSTRLFHVMQLRHDIEHGSTQCIFLRDDLAVLDYCSASVDHPCVPDVTEHRLHADPRPEATLPVVAVSHLTVCLHSVLVEILAVCLQCKRTEEALVVELFVVRVAGGSAFEHPHLWFRFFHVLLLWGSVRKIGFASVTP